MVDVSGSSVSRSSASSTARVFNVASDTDILQLLHFVRRGPFQSEEKNTLRDLVLDFTGSKDTALLAQVNEMLAPAGARVAVTEVPASPTMPSAPTRTFGFGQARPSPTFTPVNVPVASAVTPATVAPEPVGSPSTPNETVTAPSSHPDTVDAVSRNPEPVPPTPTTPADPALTSIPNTEPVAERKLPVQSFTETPVTPAQAVAAPSSPPSAIPDAAVAPKSQAPTVAPPVPPAEPPAAPPTPPAPATAVTTDPLTRIKEIKKAVNEKVGNPVNLIDANNEVGREYMNALLNAMRVVNGGSKDEVSLAMERLEKSFTAVRKTIGDDASASTTSAPEPEPTPTPTPTPEPSTVAETPESVDSTVKNFATPTSVDEPPAQSLPKELPVPPPPPAPAPVGKTDMQKLAEESRLEIKPKSPPTPPPRPPQQKNDAAMMEVAAAPATTTATTRATSPLAPAAPVGTANTAPQPSIADKVRQLQAEQQATLQEKVKENVTAEQQASQGDPLLASDVTAGLQQLLNDWHIFRGSGLFGISTGPSGYEHPLYNALSALPMAAVIAGRYEGATPKVRQSITDYMNGWRYEQGIVHEMGETFEHYLRRVVKEILEKRQKPTA